MFITRKDFFNLEQFTRHVAERTAFLEERIALLQRTVEQLLEEKKPVKKVAAAKRTQK